MTTARLSEKQLGIYGYPVVIRVSLPRAAAAAAAAAGTAICRPATHTPESEDIMRTGATSQDKKQLMVR